MADGVLKRLCVLSALLVAPVLAQEAIPAEELARAPTQARIEMLVDRAAQQGWGSAIPMMRAGAQQAYESGSGYASQWYYLQRWARLFGTPYNKATDDWIEAVNEARVGHANMASSYPRRSGSLAAIVPRESQLALLGNAAFSEEFFQVLAPVDNPAEVLGILHKLYETEPALFAAYPSLAIAIAVVYDVPPPPGWPHGQVSVAGLPRRPPAPEKLFGYLARLDRAGGTAHKLGRLPAAELKFLVDIVAPFSELDWARQQVGPGLTDFAKAYDLIKYRKDRVAANQYHWPGGAYTLQAILAEGGICVDQAYFASTAGKAKGIPTIMFRGAGLDGRHAWFGYLGAGQRWQLDCGRYAEQKYVTGFAFDPQTWSDINDHELLFITERFRALPTYKLSVMHAEFAADYLGDGKPALALKAAREAVNRDRRNLAAWQVLLAAQNALAPADLRAREALVREAMLAFQRYPDLEIGFSRDLVAILRQRGETSLADFEEQRLGKKYQAARQDLSIGQAAVSLQRSMQQDDPATQIRVFNRLLDAQGRGSPLATFDELVEPFVLHLAKSGQIPAALQALAKARGSLAVAPGSQLDGEMKALEKRLRDGGK